MPAQLTDEQLAEFQRRLEMQRSALHQEIQEELQRSDNTHFTDVAGEVHDQEEASVASLVIDVDLANIDRHVQEIHELEAALMRIGSREFGICMDCEQQIALARLEANPTAERCILCQNALEKIEAQFNSPTASYRSL